MDISADSSVLGPAPQDISARAMGVFLLMKIPILTLLLHPHRTNHHDILSMILILHAHQYKDFFHDMEPSHGNSPTSASWKWDSGGSET